MQRAVDVSAAGEPVIIAPGTYTGNVVLKRETSFVRGTGTTPADVVIQGTIDATAVARDWEIRNLSLRPTSSTTTHGLRLQRGSGIDMTIASVDIQLFPGDGIHISGSGGNVDILDAVLSRNDADGLGIDAGSGDMRLIDTKTHQNLDDGVQFRGVSGGNIVIQRLWTERNTAAGFQIEGMSGGSFAITASCFQMNGSQPGVFLSLMTGGSLTTTVSNIRSNTSGGATITTSSVTPDMRDNFWGSPSGPAGAGPGSGDSVTSGILFNPFRTAVLSNGGCP